MEEGATSPVFELESFSDEDEDRLRTPKLDAAFYGSPMGGSSATTLGPSMRTESRERLGLSTQSSQDARSMARARSPLPFR